MKKHIRKFTALLLSGVMMAGLAVPAAAAYPELDPQITYSGAGLTFEKVSHANTSLGEPDGVVDYAGNGSVAVHDPNVATDLVGDRGQSYSYAMASHGDWVYVGTMYGGLGAAAIISTSLKGMEGIVDVMYNGRLYSAEPDGKNAGGIFFKFNVKTGETVMLLSKDTNGIIPTFRSACEMNGKLYFVGMVQDVEMMQGQPSVTLPTYYGIDMLNEAMLYQNGLPVIYEVTPSDEADGDVLTRIYDVVGDDLDVYKSMVQQNMFTSTRAIGPFRDTLIAGAMDENGPFLAASNDPSGGQETFKEIANLDDLFGYPAYERDDASGGGGIYQVVEFNGNLYVAIVSGHGGQGYGGDTTNPETGTKRSFAIVRGEIAEGADPTVKENWTWSVLVGDKADGAKYTFGISEDRVACNACTLQVYNDYLYIGDYNDVNSALQGFIGGKQFKTQATNLEQSLNLYRMDAGEDIEMVVGDPNEMFPEGGISGWGSGYETHMSQYHWQTTVYDGKMYLSTMDTTSLLEPIAQFVNGDLLKMSKEEWESQINYIRIFLENMLAKSAAEGAAYDTEGMSEDEMIAYTADIIGDAARQIAGVLARTAELSEDQICDQIQAILDDLKAQMPEAFMGMFDMIASFLTEENIKGLLKSMPYLITSEAGFDLYALEELEDGSVQIETVTNNGFGDMNNHGLRVFAETDNYFVIGTANPFMGTQLWRSEKAAEEEIVIPQKAVVQYTIKAVESEGGTISPAGVSKVRAHNDITYTITPDEGYVIKDVLVDCQSVGAVSQYTFEDVRASHTILVQFAKADVQVLFDDVHADDWFYDDVQFVYDNDLMNGVGDGKFNPAGTTNRAMIVTVLWRLAGEPSAPGSAGFSDVPADQWYTDAVNWAAANSIVNGFENGTFGPLKAITREQVAAIFQRYAEFQGLDTEAAADVADYVYSAWAEENVIWAESIGLYDNIGVDVSNLTKAASRAEIASYLHVFFPMVAE